MVAHDPSKKIYSVDSLAWDHVMYQPDGNGNIWVPIGELLWHWRGSAHYIATYKKQLSGSWRTISGSLVQPGAAENHSFYGAYDSADRLLSDSTNTYTYDEEGNLLTRTTKAGGLTTSCTWTAEHRLIGIKYADGTTATIKYDPLGRMVEIDESTRVTRYADDQQNLAAEYDGTNTLTASFIQDPTTTNRALEMVRGGQRYFYIADAEGSIVALTTLSGTAAATYSYTAFGAPAETGTLDNPITYTGQFYEGKAGLLLFPLRAYDPSLGRFLSEDPVQSLNPYPYARNSPTNAVDPSGAELVEDTVIRNRAAQLIYAAIRRSWTPVFTCTTLLVANILFEITGDVLPGGINVQIDINAGYTLENVVRRYCAQMLGSS